MNYAPAPESVSRIDLASQYLLYIGGKYVPATDGQMFGTVNPSTGQLLSQVSYAGKRDIDRAVKAARKAYDTTWTRISASQRAVYLYRIARAITERSKELALIETLDNGKPIRETRDFDVPLAGAHFFYYAGWADKLEFAGAGGKRHPYGVVAQVIPWNFPLLMLAWKVAPALAAGNTVVLKPAETTPLSALVFADICQSVGLPDGVVNIVTGDGATGQYLVNHPGVDKVAFTGSSAVGKAIATNLAGSGKSLTLELGGKGANIVLDDAPVNQAVEGIVNSVFFNQGHVCCAGSRLLVQEPLFETVLDKLQERMRNLNIGDPLDKNTDMGAVNSQAQLDRIEAYTQIAKEQGATVWDTGCPLPRSGYWFRPTLLTNISGAQTVAREEVFGPVLSIMTFRTEDEAIAKANSTPYGLSAGVWSSTGARALAVSQRLQAGVVWLNSFNKFDPASPFGGFNESGFGREGGPQGLDAYLSSSYEGEQQT